MAQTEQFMLRMGTFGPDLLDESGGMPEYRERVKEVITPKFSTSFDQEAATAEHWCRRPASPGSPTSSPPASR